MNRHERRKAGRQLAVSVEIVGNEQISRRAEWALTVAAIAAAAHSPRPAKCATCEGLLTPANPPIEWVLLERLDTRDQLLSGLCRRCASAGDYAIVQRVASLIGVTPARAVHPHAGRA